MLLVWEYQKIKALMKDSNWDESKDNLISRFVQLKKLIQNTIFEIANQ